MKVISLCSAKVLVGRGSGGAFGGQVSGGTCDTDAGMLLPIRTGGCALCVMGLTGEQNQYRCKLVTGPINLPVVSCCSPKR